MALLPFEWTFRPNIWGAAVGLLVSVISFVCSIGNVPMAAILWNGGISFGVAISFIYADLIIIAILNIYRKYYGIKMTVFLFLTSYLAMVLAGLIVEALFDAHHLAPAEHRAKVVEASIQWNYTTVLNLLFAIVAALLVMRFLRTGGREMLAMMDESPEEHVHPAGRREP